MDKQEELTKDRVMKYAPVGVLKFCAAILVITMSIVWVLISAKTVGIDFEPIFKAWAHSIHFETVCEMPTSTAIPEEIEHRLQHLEGMAHSPSGK